MIEPWRDRMHLDPSVPLEDRVAAIVAAAAVVLDVDSVGAMLRDVHGDFRLIGASDELARLMETVQIDTGSGPGMETARTGDDVAIADLGSVAEPNAWANRLRAAGAGAVLSSPIIVGGVVVGNLNAVIRAPHIWTPHQIRAQRAYARVIAAMLNLVVPPGSSAVARHSTPSGRFKESAAEPERHADRP